MRCDNHCCKCEEEDVSITENFYFWEIGFTFLHWEEIGFNYLIDGITKYELICVDTCYMWQFQEDDKLIPQIYMDKYYCIVV